MASTALQYPGDVSETSHKSISIDDLDAAYIPPQDILGTLGEADPTSSNSTPTIINLPLAAVLPGVP